MSTVVPMTDRTRRLVGAVGTVVALLAFTVAAQRVTGLDGPAAPTHTLLDTAGRADSARVATTRPADLVSVQRDSGTARAKWLLEMLGALALALLLARRPRLGGADRRRGRPRRRCVATAFPGRAPPPPRFG